MSCKTAFFSLALDEVDRMTLHAIATSIEAAPSELLGVAGTGFSATPYEKLHLTFVFCGEQLSRLPRERLTAMYHDIRVVTEAASLSLSGCRLTFQNLSLFPPGKNNLIVAHFDAPRTLRDLRQAVYALCLEAGVAVTGDDEWAAHVTLGKIKATRAQLGKVSLHNVATIAPELPDLLAQGIILLGAQPKQAGLSWDTAFAFGNVDEERSLNPSNWSGEDGDEGKPPPKVDGSVRGEAEENPEACTAAPASPHRFHLSKDLQRRMEAQKHSGRWANVRGIVETNDKIVSNKGFKLPDGGHQPVPDVPATIAIHCVSDPFSAQPTTTAEVVRFETTDVCVANTDTLSAALALGNACALNFANADVPGGRYRFNGRAQEEDLCRLLPQLYPSLETSGGYPIAPDTALVTPHLMAVRRPGTYELCTSLGECTVVTAAMPCGPIRPKSGWVGSEWEKTATLRIRAVLNAARQMGHPNLVLGAFGCGAYGNPPNLVAAIFREQLASPEFRGAFSKIVFAIIDPMGTGNIKPFQEQIQLIANYT
ncbi:hypothetical protein CYMTET_23894 [Cymbomonas tetramitiformis]|uniref:Microbial-type PARG catalytic domain-containing protein n=1 Tax=Cymbomonas tetramitiformis TaxID=36881 RepID=A0AAE0FXT1_9CHLO|nr:hypothetical protein CYMTET_23894 [Cymbomonas tetramitiformis]|eukprot:gene14954-17675_t